MDIATEMVLMCPHSPEFPYRVSYSDFKFINLSHLCLINNVFHMSPEKNPKGLCQVIWGTTKLDHLHYVKDINFLPGSVKQTCIDISYRVSYSDFQFINVSHLCLIINILHISPEKKSKGVVSGDRWGKEIGPPRPIQLSGKRFPILHEQWYLSKVVHCLAA